MTALLEAAGLQHGYNGHRVLNDFSLALARAAAARPLRYAASPDSNGFPRAVSP
jgi:hypothetical protein